MILALSRRYKDFPDGSVVKTLPVNAAQHKRRLYTWMPPDGQHRNQIDYILCSQRWRTFIQSAKTRPGSNCGSDHELLIAKCKLKLKKVGKTTRPFRYCLNQIPYNYTVEVRDGFKRIDLIDRVLDELWTKVHDIVRETGVKSIPKKKECKKAKWLSEDERVTGRKARGLQTEEIGCNCQTFFSLLSGRKKQTSDIFSSLYKFKRMFLLKCCVAITPGFTWS